MKSLIGKSVNYGDIGRYKRKINVINQQEKLHAEIHIIKVTALIFQYVCGCMHVGACVSLCVYVRGFVYF